MLGQHALKLILAAILVTVSSVLALPAIVEACCPEPPGTTPGEQLKGPAVVGTATITPTITPTIEGISVTFVGRCKGQPANFSNPTVGIPYADVTEQALDQFRPGSTGDLPGCYPFVGDLIINTVVSFSKDAAMAVAEIVLLGVELP